MKFGFYSLELFCSVDNVTKSLHCDTKDEE